MKQNSIFSCVKRNNNNSEGVDGNDEQYSSNVKEALPPKRRSGIQLPRLENGTTRIWDTGSICRMTKCWM